MTSAVAAQPTAASESRLSGLSGRMELIIVILLGLASVATAYVSFQAALYDSQMAGAYTKGQAASTAAESLYLEANQQYIQDVQVWNRLTELSIDMGSTSAQVAATASAKFDTLYFQSVSDTLGTAITWSEEQNTLDPASYTSPFDSEDYLGALFNPYLDGKQQADALIAEGDNYNTLSDRLTLNTVLMALSLFLLGIAAVLRNPRSQIVLTAIATGVFLFAIALTATIPYVGI